MPADELLTYRQLADRIEQALGVRPALSSLRAAAAVDGRGHARTRLTAGLPTPVEAAGAAGQTLFRASAVDAWLAEHPRRRIARLQQHLAQVPAADRAGAVAQARRDGLSWSQIAVALASADGTTYSRQWAQQRYRDS